MIKFILAVIAMIFVGLAAYVYLNPKERDTPTAKVAQETERSIVKKEAPSVQQETTPPKLEVVSEKKSSIKNITVKSSDVVSRETTQEMVDIEDDGIENANLSDKEKIDRAIIDELNTPEVTEELPTEEEIRQIIFEDNK